MRLGIEKLTFLYKIIKGFFKKMANKDILGFGKDTESNAKPLGVAKEKNKELMTYSIEEMMLFQKILKELKKFNEQLEMITATKLTTKDAHAYRDKL